MRCFAFRYPIADGAFACSTSKRSADEEFMIKIKFASKSGAGTSVEMKPFGQQINSREELVIGVGLNGHSRAYPFFI